MRKYFVTGGAGFIGGHMIRRLFARSNCDVVAFDNFSSGRLMAPSRRQPVNDRPRRPERPRALDRDNRRFGGRLSLRGKPGYRPGHDAAGHRFLAGDLSDPKPAGGDARRERVPRLIYASGSGVYGDTGERAVTEHDTPLRPISTYGASKLACEALIWSYAHMFELDGVGFRFANVVGPRQTHGVAYDFIRQLLRDPARLEIKGDGLQSKSYVHVDDVVDAMLLVLDRGWSGFDVFNVATEDYLTVRQIATLVAGDLGLGDVEYSYSGGRRGWKGDVPVVRFDTARLRGSAGAINERRPRPSGTQSNPMIADARAGKFEVRSAPATRKAYSVATR